MTRRLATAALTLLAAASGFLGLAGSASAQTGAPVPTSAALTTLERCVEDRHALLALLLVDESGSLSTTDPGNERVTAARLALDGLGRLAARSSAKADVEVQVAGFANDFDNSTGWGALDDRRVAQLDDAIEAFAARNKGFDTDYAHALAGAQREFGERSAALTAAGGKAPCKLLLWFTDGSYSIDSGDTKDYAPDATGPRGSKEREAQIIEAGRRLICDPNGVADQLHRDNVTIAAVPLSSVEAPIAPDDLAFLGSVTNGTAAGTSCGTLGSATTGTTIPASDLGEVLAAFDELGQIGGTPEPGRSEQPICATSACPEGTRNFVIDASMTRFHLLAQPGVEGIVVQLTAPGVATPVSLPATQRSGVAKAGATTLRYSWISPTVLVVDGEPSDATVNWAGTWSVTFIDPSGQHPGAVARSRIYLFSGLAPKLTERPVLRRGERNVLNVGVEAESGVPVSAPSALRGLDLRATVVDPITGRSTPLDVTTGPGTDGTSFRVVYDIPADYSSSTANLDLDLSVTTAGGVTLDPTARQYELPVAAPIQYPRLSPAVLRLPSVSGTGSTTGTIVATATKQAGCVWIDRRASKFPDHPSDSGPIHVSVDGDATSRSRCVEVPAGATRRIDVTLSPSGNDAGSVQGAVVVGLAANGEREAVATRVPTTFDTSLAVDEGTRWVVVLLMLIGGIGAPLLLMWWLSNRESRFQPTERMKVAVVPVVLTAQTVTRRELAGVGTGDSLIDTIDDLRAFQPVTPERLRILDVAGVPGLTLRARTPRFPFGMPRAEAQAAGRVLVSSERRAAQSVHLDAVPVGLSLAGAWLFVADEIRSTDDDRTEILGTLVAFFGPGAVIEQATRISGDVRDHLPTTTDRLLDLLAQADASSAAGVPVTVGGSSSSAVEDEPPWIGDGTSAAVPPPPFDAYSTPGDSLPGQPTSSPDLPVVDADDEPPWIP